MPRPKKKDYIPATRKLDTRFPVDFQPLFIVGQDQDCDTTIYGFQVFGGDGAELGRLLAIVGNTILSQLGQAGNHHEAWLVEERAKLGIALDAEFLRMRVEMAEPAPATPEDLPA